KRLPRGRKLAFLAAPEPAPGADNLQVTAEPAAVL
ncbi:GIY-YIG nuclease family protein, partial [Pantoea dispersa]